jgi:molecular chaperone DnaK (HSP70)
VSDAPGEDVPDITVLSVPQLVAEREVDGRPVLPSFVYLASEQERSSGSMALPWNERPTAVAGVFARDRGALEPGRQISSAKSWLAHGAVDRMARLLPWGKDDPDLGCSPVEATTTILRHVRDAWNHLVATGGITSRYRAQGDVEQQRFERQDIVLTVPASFDEEARELTVEAARHAGFEHLTLLEEPLAAFYAWTVAHRRALDEHLNSGETILVCDVGGGTADFSLIRVQFLEGAVHFERTAIGEHVLLGGDNIDLALARLVEEKMGATHLTLSQRNALRRQCSVAKEKLLADESAGNIVVTVLGAGRTVVGTTLTAVLTRDEVTKILLEGFLPITRPNDLPAREPGTGLRELGLPYARDAALTKHLAAFLRGAAGSIPSSSMVGEHTGMAKPDAVLFNGGFFTPVVARERVAEAIGRWFDEAGDWKPRILEARAPESAVAIGAAYYAHVRKHGGLQVRAGSGRAYYIGVGSDEQEGRTKVVCVMPRGAGEGTRFELTGRRFKVATNQPVSFTLWSSSTRDDREGEVIVLDRDELHRHAPLTTVLRYGRKSRRTELEVGLVAYFTEVGTLELWCESRLSEHRWRLQFQLRAAAAAASDVATGAQPSPEVRATGAVVPEEALDTARSFVRALFSGEERPNLSPETVVAQLEGALGYAKQAWPITVIRPLCDALVEVADGRRRTPKFEARWLNLFGFCLRPGFGAAADEWRVDNARSIYASGLAFPSDIQCQVEWLILWQRVAGGLSRGQQRELYQRYASQLGIEGGGRPARLSPQVEREGWRLLASLEHLPAATRSRIGDVLARKIRRDHRNASYLWALGRLGARIPFHGPLSSVVPPAEAAEWIDMLMSLRELTTEALSALAQIAARTDDPLRDIDETLRARVAQRLVEEGASADLLSGLRQFRPPTAADAARVFGESLPEGLRLSG